MDAVLRDLPSDLIEVSGGPVLHGEEGARIFDRTGEEHGFATRLVRFFQHIGYDNNILAVYEEGLNAGEALITVPCPHDDRLQVARALRARGGHAIIYFGAGMAETLTAP